MGVGTKRGKGDRGQFEALERIYTVTAHRDPAKLIAYVSSLATDLRAERTTCDALLDIVTDGKLGPDAIASINTQWYGRGADGASVAAHWYSDSSLNPAEIQMVNRAATIYTVGRLVELAQLHGEEVSLQIWGQCNHPHFFIELLEFTPPGPGPGTTEVTHHAPYLVLDYYVPFNVGYGEPADDARRYPAPTESSHHQADFADVGLARDGVGRIRFFHTRPGKRPTQGQPDADSTPMRQARDDCHRAISDLLDRVQRVRS
ncbi:MAG: hypothetical protein IT196_00410 [Acidimicrobiales bacterium]|nr:hypothetical protein [Acidimicrobiales bacterium]